MQKRWMLLTTALLMPVLGMAYLYSRNSEYLSGMQVVIVSAGMVIISALGYGLLRLIFRSSASAMIGCLVAWVAFFAFGAALHDVIERFVRNYYAIVLIFASGTILLTLLAALLARKVKGQALGMMAFTMACVMLLLNGVPAVVTALNLERHKADASLYKTEFAVDAALPSPNVYWIHADGMLGFDAMLKYFGDDQVAFSEALTERGFMINPSASFEAAHTTSLAVPSLLSPAFYDAQIAPKAQDHDEAMALRLDKQFSRNEALTARVQSETRLAFEQKGYQSQTLSGFGIYFPPVTDRFYMTGDSRGAYRLDMRSPGSTFQSIVEMTELSILLLKMPSGMFFNALTRVSDVVDLGIKRHQLAYALTPEERLELVLGSKAALGDALLFDALNDSIKTQQAPAFSMLFFLGAHYPYSFQEDGQRVTSNPLDIMNYAGNHKYASKLLINMVDMILAGDPDAVIVIQGDHGLHSQSAQTITKAFGEDAVLPIWNQVVSVMRVPEAYRNGDEAYAMANPLNISRYLMNRFVGEQYPYLNKEGV